MGPDAPITMRAVCEGMRDFMRMSTPAVMLRGGAGKTKGNEVRTPKTRQATKWPSSWVSRMARSVREKGRPLPMRSGFSQIQAKRKRSVKLVRGALPSSKFYM
jgi:hypothetical protein